MDEADTALQDADVICRFDMFEELDFRPGYASCKSPTLADSVIQSTYMLAGYLTRTY